MNVHFDHVTDESPTIKTFYFTPEKPINYIAGQFIELTLPHTQPDNRGTKRWFTLSSSPHEQLISITTRIVPDSSSFKQKLALLKHGESLTISEPMGDFVLPKDASIPLVFVAGGIGITPFLSIARWLHHTKEARLAKLIHAVHDEDDIIFNDTFTAANFYTTVFVSKPSPAWGGEQGMLTSEHIRTLAEPAPNALIYLAGPEPMIDALTQGLRSLRVPNYRLITDYFPGYAEF